MISIVFYIIMEDKCVYFQSVLKTKPVNQSSENNHGNKRSYMMLEFLIQTPLFECSCTAYIYVVEFI